jgi:hypothetical protein
MIFDPNLKESMEVNEENDLGFSYTAVGFNRDQGFFVCLVSCSCRFEK